MLYHIKHITLIAVVGIMLCLVMAACSDSNAEDAIGMDDVRVAFTLAVADVRTTRAANEGWDDYDHPLPGIEKENMINPDDLYITRVRDNIQKSKEQKNIQPTKGGHKMVTCQNYVSLFYCQITSCPSDGGIS